MKHLYEYEDLGDLDSLLGDLGSLGIETLQGWIIIWNGEYDLPRTEIIIAPSSKEALAIYMHRGYFAPDFQKMIKAKYKDATKTTLTEFIKNEPNIKAEFDLWFNMLVNQGKVRKFTAVKNLGVSNDVNTSSYSSLEENPDPYHQIHIFNKLFTNASKKFEEVKKSNRTSKDLVTIPLDSEEFAPDNRVSSGGWMP